MTNIYTRRSVHKTDRFTWRCRVELIDLDTHYLRVGIIIIKILNQFHMQIEYVAERARKVHDRESIWEYVQWRDSTGKSTRIEENTPQGHTEKLTHF